MVQWLRWVPSLVGKVGLHMLLRMVEKLKKKKKIFLIKKKEDDADG